MKMKRPPYKKGTTGYLVWMFLLIALFVALIVWVNRSVNVNTENSTSSESASSQSAETPAPTPDVSENKEFVLLESKKPTLQGRNGYFTQEENGEKIWERDKVFAETWCTPETAVADLKTFLGNQVYAIPTSAITGDSVPEGAEDPTIYVQLYGYSPNIVDSDGYVRNTSIWMREEYTGKRIYVFRTHDELNDALKAWDEGQAILNGTSNKKDALIVNGRLVDGGYPVSVNGEWYIPLTYVAAAVNPELFHNNTETQVLTIPLQGCYAGATISVPYTLGSPGAFKLETFDAGNYNSNLGEGTENVTYWVESFRTGDGGACYVPASELSRYTGWYIYTNGNSIHVVTDETDVSNLFLYNNQGNRSVEGQLSMGGDTIVKYTDPNDGKLYDMMVEDGKIVETPEDAEMDDSSADKNETSADNQKEEGDAK